MKIVDVTGVKLKVVEDEVVAGVRSTCFLQLSPFVLGVEKSVSGVSR